MKESDQRGHHLLRKYVILSFRVDETKKLANAKIWIKIKIKMQRVKIILKKVRTPSVSSQSTSKSAQSTSKSAQSTSKSAQSAQSTSKSAQSTSKSAQSAQSAQSTSKSAQSTSKSAQSTSKSAQSTSKSTQLTGNEKRKASCKKVGGAKKREGHSKETLFNSFWGNPDAELTYKAEADCTIFPNTQKSKELMKQLDNVFNLPDSCEYKCSLKSGISLQFTLGRIPEISEAKTREEKLAAFKKPELWRKYLMKDQSNSPADFMVYRDSEKNVWVFFLMEEVVQHIANECSWRFTESGRSIKGDFEDSSRKGRSVYLTYEHRSTHNSDFLGANCGLGKKFIELLKDKLTHLVVSDPK